MNWKKKDDNNEEETGKKYIHTAVQRRKRSQTALQGHHSPIKADDGGVIQNGY